MAQIRKLKDDDIVEIRNRSQAVAIWQRFNKNRLAMFGLFILLVLVIVAITAPLYISYEGQVIKQQLKLRLQTPNSNFWFGTDQFGRDMLARIIWGARVSLSMGVISISVSLVVGAMIGSIAGYYGGKVDNWLMRIMDVFLAIPQTLMAISIVAALGGGLMNLLIAMTISSIPRFSRIVRSAILSIKGQEYIEAAKACASTDFRIIMKHIIPNAIGPIVVQATLNLASTIIAIAGLSFIGLGINPPTPEWGTMLSEGKEYMRNYPHLVVIPGVAIMFAVMGLNLVGDGLRDALDPRLKN